MLFVICWSGTIAVFAHEIDWLLNPALRVASFHGPMPWQGAHDAVNAAYPSWEIIDVSAPRYAGFAMEIIAQPEPDKSYRIYVDPNTLQVLGDSSYFNVQRFFRSFHMALFQPDWVHVAGIPIGYFAVVIFTFPLLASLVTSLVFYKRWWRGFWKLERRKGAKIFWSDVHKLTGVWSLWFVAIISLTGIWYLVEWWIPYRDDPVASSTRNAPPLPIDTLVERAKAEYPELEITSLGLYAAKEHIFTATGDDGTVLVRPSATVSLDNRTGGLLDIYRPADEGAVARLRETADVLHFGTFGGIWSQALYFLFGLALSAVALTGSYLHAKRQERHPEATLNLPVVASYAVTAGLLLMSAVAGWTEIKGYGIDGNWPAVTWPIQAFLLFWILSTLGALTWWVRKVH